jgi:UPF0755 protein
MIFLKRLFVFLLATLLLVGAAGFVLWRDLASPYRAFSEDEVFVEIERGMSSREIGSKLQQAGVLRAGWQLQAARLLNVRASLQAGEYRFSDQASPLEVTARLQRGDVYYVVLSVPEGLNLWEMAELIEASELKQAVGFLEEARRPDLIRDLAPEATSLEGYLFPSTYQFRRSATARDVCLRLTNEFRAQWNALNVPVPVHQTVTMASLVEKESGVPAERPLVSSVFWNRTRQGIKLDCDPTVIYAARLENNYRGTIYMSDLQRDHPYNTYRRPGLPPGPIASPGLEALRATLNPAETNYLFFVAKGDGSGEHRFSETLSGHEKNVKAYRDALQKARTAGTSSGNR